MSGLSPATPVPTALELQRSARQLCCTFDDGTHACLSFELLRVYSPSAEVRGHGAGQEVLQTGKRDVLITDIQPVGHYAVRLVFSDGHDSGLYSWDHLHQLCVNRDTLWQQYLERLTAAGASRDIPMKSPAKSSCSSGSCH